MDPILLLSSSAVARGRDGAESAAQGARSAGGDAAAAFGSILDGLMAQFGAGTDVGASNRPGGHMVRLAMRGETSGNRLMTVAGAALHSMASEAELEAATAAAKEGADTGPVLTGLAAPAPADATTPIAKAGMPGAAAATPQQQGAATPPGGTPDAATAAGASAAGDPDLMAPAAGGETRADPQAPADADATADAFETEWKRLAAGENRDLDMALLRLKPSAAQAAAMARAQTLTGAGEASAMTGTLGGEAGDAADPLHVLTGADGTRSAARGDAAAGLTRAGQPGAAASPAEQIGLQIQRHLPGGDRITVQLQPRELGSVEVRLEFVDDMVHARVIVERQETLDLLQRDSRSLERALNDAGLKTDSGSLSFNLRDGRGDGRGDGSADGHPDGTAAADEPDAGEPDGSGESVLAGEDPLFTATHALRLGPGRFDIRI